RLPSAKEDGRGLGREQPTLALRLRQQRVDVTTVLLAPSAKRDEVAVAAAMRAERQVDVEMTGGHTHFRSPSRFSTARKASCGTSTIPTCFIRRLPAFCRSSSLRLRVM